MIDTRTAPYAALTLRVALGVMFIAHALLKLLVFTLPGTVGFFQSLGLTNHGTQPCLITGGRWVAGVLAIGFLAIPVLIFFKAIGG